MGFTPTESIWFNGKLVPWNEAKVHVLAHGLQYGTGVFEGMKSYPTADGPAIFRLDSHLERFYKSAELYDLQIPYSIDTLSEASLDVVRANGLEASYLRPVAFFDAATHSDWSKYLANADEGVRITVSPIRKFDNSAIPAWAKACGQYINSARAVNDAQRRGFDEALLLNSQGLVAEGSGENLFVVKNGALITNDKDASILMGITRASVLEIAADLGIETRVAQISMEDVLGADELFFSGTAVEVTRIREVDGTVIGDGKLGPVTRRIQETFNQAVRGQLPQYRRWLSFVRQPVPSA
jgi:branched-chain amino acid aminotransferase